MPDRTTVPPVQLRDGDDIVVTGLGAAFQRSRAAVSSR
jgi:hypothetical protein